MPGEPKLTGGPNLSAADPPEPAEERGYRALCEAFERSVRRATPGLSRADRSVAAVTAAFVAQDWDRLAAMAADPEESGLSPEEIAELYLQATIYTGTARFPEALRRLRAVLAASGQRLGFDPDRPDDVERAAAEMRRALHGARHEDGHASPASSYSARLYDVVAHHGYGLIWTRPALDLRKRLICAITALAITGPAEVFEKFVRSASEHGVEGEVLRDVVIQTVVVQGSPRTLIALMRLEEALAFG